MFAAATALAGRLDPIALTSHQIALNVASVTYMVPLGVASAGAVRVGQAIGRRDPHAASQAGWTAIAIGVGFMACSALGLLDGAVADHRPLHARTGRRRARDLAAVRGGAVPVVRRPAGCHNRRAPRPRRHAHGHDLEPGGALAGRAAGRISPLLRLGWGVHGSVDWPVAGARRGRARAPRHVGSAHPRDPPRMAWWWPFHDRRVAAIASSRRASS